MSFQLSNISALILTGGYSRRMGTDKSRLIYHDKPQPLYIADILKKYCKKIYISCRKDQKNVYYSIPAIEDAFPSEGPVTGILSAFQQQPDTPWLIVPCDMPFLDSDTIATLIQHRNEGQLCTVFACAPPRPSPQPLKRSLAATLQRNLKGSQFIEQGSMFSHPLEGKSTGEKDISSLDTGLQPLPSLWEPAAYVPLLTYHAIGGRSLRKFMENAAIHSVPVSDPRILTNVNTMEEYTEIKKLLSSPPKKRGI